MMPHNRYYLPSKLDPNTEVVIEGGEFHHLSKVMRNRPNDHIELINGQGTLAKGVIRSIEKREAIIEVEESYNELPPPFRISLVLQLLRPSQLELVIEKSTELGVSEIVLYPGKNSEKKQLSPNQLARIEGILISACKQCARLYLPSFTFKNSLKECTSLTNAFFGDPTTNFPPSTKLYDKVKKDNAATIYIGCEQGFSKDEEDFLRSHGVEGIRFHENVLRAETAAITAVSYLYALFRTF